MNFEFEHFKHVALNIKTITVYSQSQRFTGGLIYYVLHFYWPLVFIENKLINRNNKRPKVHK